MPYGLLSDSVPSPHDVHITPESLTRGGFAQALEGAGVAIERATKIMGARNAEAGVARRLGLAPGTAVLVVERTT